MTDTTPTREPRELLKRAFHHSLAAVDPASAVSANLPAAGRGRVIIISVGKAAVKMARAAAEHYLAAGHEPEGIVLSPDSSAQPASLPGGRLKFRVASHPLPDGRSLTATAEILGLLAGLSREDLVLCLLSGGGSALLNAPLISLPELIELSEALFRSGADIKAINTVRRQLCHVKGGGLAIAATPARVVTLAISDVVGDDLLAIASGPTTFDPTGPEGAVAVLDHYQLAAPAARAALQGARKPVADPEALATVENHVITASRDMLTAAAAFLDEAGYPAHILSDAITGDSRAAAAFHAALVRHSLQHAQPFAPPCALLSGGETTVTLGRDGATGSGGRNSEFALALALELWGEQRIHALAADSDGVDGTAEVAGSFVGPDLFQKADLNAARVAQDRFDSHSFFEQHDQQLISGPTGTNVNDLRIILLEAGGPDE